MELTISPNAPNEKMIPEGWSVRQLSELLQESRSIRYGVVQPGHFDDSGCLMLRSQDYSKGWAGIDGMHRVSPDLERQYKNAKIRSGDLVMTIVGAGIGQVVSIPDWLEDAVLSRSTARIAVDERNAAPVFIKSYLESPSAKRQILGNQKEGAQPVISCPDLAKFFVLMPPLSEQNAIATALSDVDALLDGLDRLIAKKRDIKQAAMQQLLTCKTRLPGFVGEWELKRLRELGEIRSGGTPSTSQAAFWDGGIPWCTPTDITALRGHKYLSETSRTISLQGLRASSAEVIPPKSLIMTSRATIGECAINEVAMTTNQGFKNIVPFAETNVEYLFYLMSTLKSALIALCGGSTFLEISKGQLANVEVQVPELEEQIAIASVLSDIDAEIQVLEKRRTKTRDFKQAMMQELLTGRTRLV